MDLSNSQLDLGLDLDYDIKAQEDNYFLFRLELDKVKVTKICEHIIFGIFILNRHMFYYFGHLYIVTLSLNCLQEILFKMILHKISLSRIKNVRTTKRQCIAKQYIISRC